MGFVLVLGGGFCLVEFWGFLWFGVFCFFCCCSGMECENPGKLDYGSTSQGELQPVFMLSLGSGSLLSLK